MEPVQENQTTHFRIQAAGLSDRGLKRTHNEDSLSVVPDLGLFIVADGMGGHSAGEVASRQAIETIVEFLRRTRQDAEYAAPFEDLEELTEQERLLSSGIRLANRDVHRLAEEHSEYHGMGTTIVGMLLDVEHSTVSIAHVGDSRCYLLREGKLTQVTLDHSWVSEQLQKNIITPEEAKNHRWKNVITRALGHRVDVEVDVQSSAIRSNDLYLLCSDGLSGMIEDDVIEQMLTSHTDLEECAQELIRTANENGGQDNISIILMRVVEEQNGKG